jgi:hypothetical protein
LSQTVNQGGNATLPTVARAGYIFAGWLPTNGHMNVTSSRTITAQWQAVDPGGNGNGGDGGNETGDDGGNGGGAGGGIVVPPTPQFTITFDLASGTRTGGGQLTQTVTQSNNATAPIATREGYTFNGWDVTFSNVQSSFTVTALWTAIEIETPPPAHECPHDCIPAHTIFDDVFTADWFHDFASMIACRGIFSGIAPRTFAPQTQMSRAMFVQALANMEGIDLTAYATSTPIFTDIEPTAWYFAAVQWAAGQNFVSGMGDGTFAPNASITREQMAVLLHRYAAIRGIELPVYETTTFTDQDTVSAWATDGVTAIQQAGIITGRGEGRFYPLETATRAEVATIFVRFLQAIER